MATISGFMSAWGWLAGIITISGVVAFNWWALRNWFPEDEESSEC